MKLKIYSTFIFTIFLIFSLSAQVTKGQAMVALDQLLNSEHNKVFKKTLAEDVAFISQNETFNAADYVALRKTYEEVTKMYNRIYLAEVKLDLTSFRQLKRLGKNPERQAKRYNDNFEEMLSYYEQTMHPLKAKINARNPQISADIDPRVRDSIYLAQQRLNMRRDGLSNFSNSIGIVNSAFQLVNSISNMIANKKRERERLIRDFIIDASRSFDSAQLSEWDLLGIPIPAIQELPDTQSSEMKNDTEEFRSQELPPTDLATLESINGQLYLEVYDESYDQDVFMNIEKGESQNLAVNDYGDSGASFDLVIGKKRKKKSETKSHMTTEYSTIDSYPSGTMYRVKASGNGYVYLFSINSGNKMFGIYPYQGTVEELPSGNYYSYPENAIFDNESGTVRISIPEGDYYIEISDSPGSESKSQETMVALFSRSQIDFKDVLFQMENMDGNISPEARIATIFGSMTATPEQGDVYLNDGVLSYYLGHDDPVILPLVIGIRRR